MDADARERTTVMEGATDRAGVGQGPGAMPSEVPATCPFAHGPTVRRALRSLGVPAELLDDAMQDVFAVVVRRAADFDRDRSITNWLWGIARGVASTHRRSQRRRARLHAALAAGGGEAIDAERPFARAEAIARIAAFVDGLPETLRETFVLAHLEGCSGPEIADRLGINLNTAYARIRSTRIRLEAAIVDEPTPWTSRLVRAFAPMLGATSKSFATAAMTISLVVIGLGVPPRAIESAPTASMSREVVVPTTQTVSPDLRHGPRPFRVHRDDTAIVLEPAIAPATTPVAAVLRPKAGARRSAAAVDTIAVDLIAPSSIEVGEHPQRRLLRPDGMGVAIHGRVKFPNWIASRRDFVPELLRLAQEV